MNTKSFSSKILLFGEYTVIQGSYALALPFDRLSGRLSFSGNHNEGFKLWIDYIQSKLSNKDLQNTDLDRLTRDIEQNLGYDSTIPIGYGLGSSGSVTAAIFDRYFDTKAYDFDATKTILGQLESFFHGTSSGLDPLVSFTHKSVLVSKKEGVKPLENDFSHRLKGFHLIDSGISRSTEKFVNIFFEKMKNQAFAEKIETMSALNNDLIADFIQGKTNTEKLLQLSHLQLEHLQELIPDHIAKIWSDGLDSGQYITKLCGAGGGGMFLAYGDVSNVELTTIDL